MHETLTRNEMEARRLAAVADIHRLTTRELGKKYGVSSMTASRWASALDHGGLDALKVHRATGRPSRLTKNQLAEIQQLGDTQRFAGRKPYTTEEMRLIIQGRFGVRFDRDYVGRLMHKLGVPVRTYRRHNATEKTGGVIA